MRGSKHQAAAAIAAAGLFTLVPVPAWAQDAPAAAETAKPRYADMSVWLARRNPKELRDPMPIGDMDSWITAADYPANALAAGEKGRVTARLSLDVSGAVMDCVPISDPDIEARYAAPQPLQELACTLLRQRARFQHALSEAGVPVAAIVDVAVYFGFRETAEPKIFPAPPASPGPPPGGFHYSPGLQIAKAPEWNRFAPPGKPSGEVVIDLYLFMRGGAEGRSCQVENRGSADRALEDATCEAAKQSGVFNRVRDYGGSIKMLVVWKNGKARDELPRRSQGVPLAITRGDPAVHGLPAGSIKERAWLVAEFGRDGRIACRVTRTSGSDATDLALCRHIRSLGFTPETDYFDRKVTVTRSYRFDP